MHFTEIFIKIYKEAVNMLLQAIFLKMATFCFNGCSAQFWHSFDNFLKCLRWNIISTFRSNNPRDQEVLLALDLSHVGPILPTIARWDLNRGIEAAIPLY